MAEVVCGGCGQAASVRLTRGTRLAGLSCPSCGAQDLHRPRPAGAGTTAGRTYETCVMCGKRGLSLLHRPYEWEPKYPDASPGPYPAGSPCCWFHEPVPAARTTHPHVIRDLEERLGPLDARLSLPDDATQAALDAIARPAPHQCPVCTAFGHSQESMYAVEDGDFSASQAYQFDRGSALLAWCWDCGHTLELAALRPGGPHVATVTVPAQQALWEPLQWAVTVRALSPKLGAGEVDMYWAGPVHGHRGTVPDIPNCWIGTDPGSPQVMRFPSPEAARAALDSVFAPGSRWTPADVRRPVRIVAVPDGPAHPVDPGWPAAPGEGLTAASPRQPSSRPGRPASPARPRRRRAGP